MLTLNDGRSELWQWDTGRTLAVDADCSQVHFSNKVFGRSIDVDVTDGVAIIPDVLLQTDKDLNVWAFIGTAENGYTKISKTFKVNRRNKPADYVFTPVEQTTIAEIAAIAQSVRDDADAGLFNGEPGDNGITPHIGDNGNWYLGATDTGKPSRGATGSKGDTGAIGPTGPVGPQGPAGAPGKDGAGMDITGATVGQIAKITAVDASGVPTEWSPVDMPEQVQPDWNQNDDTQPDYVKNRPFYSETKIVTVDNATAVAQDEALVLEGFPVFAVGDTVTVSVDGVEHSLVAFDDEGDPTIGDTSSSVGTAEEQFGWFIYYNGSDVSFYAKEAHTVSYLVVVGHHKIDPKYLPDSVLSAIDADAYQVRLLQKDLGEWVLERGTYDVIREKLANGEPINVKIADIYNDYQHFSPVGNIYYDDDGMCIKIRAFLLQSLSLKVLEFSVKAGNIISAFYYDLQ